MSSEARADAARPTLARDNPEAYIPRDRRRALAMGLEMQDRVAGSALFADISGFTPLTEALRNELGPQRGSEELTANISRVFHEVIGELDAFAGDTFHKAREPAVVVHVPVGKHHGLDTRQVHTQGAGIMKCPLFGKPEIKERLPAFAPLRQADHGRKPMFGQDAHPVAGGIFRSRPLNDGRTVMGGNVDEIVLQSEDLHFVYRLELNGHDLSP
jgi:hypothetical protein